MKRKGPSPWKPLTPVEEAFARAKLKLLKQQIRCGIAPIQESPSERLSSVPAHTHREKPKTESQAYTEAFMMELFREVTGNPVGWNGKRR